MVNKIALIIESLTRRHGPVYLAAILLMDELVDKWTIVLSAPWINNSEIHKQAFSELVNDLKKELDPEELHSIARLAIFPKEAHLIEELLKYSKGAEIDSPQKINGNQVYRGHIIESQSEINPHSLIKRI